MSDKAEKKPESPAKDAAAKEGGAKDAAGAAGAKKGGMGALLTKLPVMLGGVMIIEAAVLFAGFKFLGSGPKNAAGADLTTTETENAAEEHGAKSGEQGGGHGKEGDAKPAGPKRKTVELQVLDFKAQNKTTGRMFMYDVSIYVVTKSDFETKVKDTIKANEALIKDRVRTIIAQNDPEKLGGGSEPGLETLRRQIKHQLDEIIGDGMVQEVLVPKCIPFRADY